MTTLEQMLSRLGVQDLHAYAKHGQLPFDLPAEMRPTPAETTGHGADQVVAVDRATGHALIAEVSRLDAGDEPLATDPKGTGWYIGYIAALRLYMRERA